MKFGAKLKECREACSMTQRQVAAELVIDCALYNRYEKGERKMKRESVVHLANLYKVSEEELIKYWLADQVYNIVYKEEMASEALSIVAEDMPAFYTKAK